MEHIMETKYWSKFDNWVDDCLDEFYRIYGDKFGGARIEFTEDGTAYVHDNGAYPICLPNTVTPFSEYSD
jgi:hypothetical protein